MGYEKVLEYSRDQVTQDTYYWCGPASAQTVIRAATGTLYAERLLASYMGTTIEGTPDISNVKRALDKYAPAGAWQTTYITGNAATVSQRDLLWTNVTASINAGYGVVANIIAPPSNYPRAAYTSTQSPAYAGGVVYHYIALMGYAYNESGRYVWVADSGFRPYGYWVTMEQLADLIAGKGYAYSTAAPKEKDTQVDNAKIDRIHHELTHEFQSRYKKDGKLSPYRDTLVGYVLNNDEKLTRLIDDVIPAMNRKLNDILDRVNHDD